MKTRDMTKVSILAAVTVILSLIKIPIIPIAPFLTLDFSDLPLMMIAKKESNMSRIILMLATILIILFNGGQLPVIIGLIAQFIFSLVIILGISHQWSFLKILLLELIIMILLNCLIVLPLYEWVLNFHLSYSIGKYILLALIPFNLIKVSMLYFIFSMFRNVG